MTFKPSDFVEIADDLLQDKKYDLESGYRTIISRAYYGCFLHMRKDLGLQAWKPKDVNDKGEIHSVVIKTFKKKDPTLGDFLDKLRRKRNDSDYHLNLEILKKDAVYMVTLAKQII